MNEIKTHDLPISEKFLKSMHELTKTAIKTYLSLDVTLLQEQKQRKGA